MAEYIKREDLISKFKQMRLGEHGLIEKIFADGVYTIIENAPAADVAPVVRCKDCKWFADNNGGEWFGCQMFQVVLITPEDTPKPDDFCSYGERKETDSD